MKSKFDELVEKELRSYITISPDASAYGSDCTEEEKEQINDTMTKAAKIADVDVIIDENPLDSGYDEGIDWFETYCREGQYWNSEAWAAWLRRQK